jgi:MOSC domain-containing protein YiiM
MTTNGRVEAIRIAAAGGAPMVSVERVGTHAGGGLDGDRYHLGTDEYSSSTDTTGRGLTLVAVESLAAANAEHPGLDVSPEDTRRNVTVSGVDLDALIGRVFRIGSVRCAGVRRAEPCAYLEGRLGRPILRQLAHRAGLRVDILEDGEIAVGDEVVPA